MHPSFYPIAYHTVLVQLLSITIPVHGIIFANRVFAQTPYPPTILPTASPAALPTASAAASAIAPIATGTTAGTATGTSAGTVTSEPSIPADAQLGPMPKIQPAIESGDPEDWGTPDQLDRTLERPATYTLAPGDRINVSISTVPEFSGVYQVMVDGRITLPVIGQLDVRDMTEPEAALYIAKRYTEAQVLVKPTITVVLAEMSNLHVAILGEVSRPGAYIVTPQNGELPKLTEIIEKAGGITQQTDLKNIQIRRPQRNGKTWQVQTSLWKLLTTGDLSQDLAIRDGDTIMLQSAQDISIDVAKTVSQSNLTQGEILINLVGEVMSPGIQKIQIGTSLNQALLMAGGLTGQAKKKSVELLRLNPNGTVTRRKIDIDYNSAIDEIRNPMLQNRDVILVDRSMGAKLTEKIGNILTPINSVLSIFNLFSSFIPRSR